MRVTETLAMASPRLAFACAGLLALSLCAPVTASAVPASMAVEGVLHSSAGGAAGDGVYKITFALYASAKGGKSLWLEGPTNIAVKGGQFQHEMGMIKPIAASLMASAGKVWLGITIDNDAELARTPLHSVAYAMTAAQAAKLACSGCVAGAHLAAGAVSADKVGFTYAGAKTKGGPAANALDLQCTGCVSLSELKLDGDLDLGSHALKAKTIKASTVSAGQVVANAFIGDGSKLTGISIPSGSCKSGQVVAGIKADGSLQCTPSMNPNNLPADGIDEISNDLIHNQFVDEVYGTKKVVIADNNPTGTSDVLNFPDIGIAQKLDIKVELNNSDISTVAVWLFAPDNSKYVLYNKAGKGKTLKASYPNPTKPVSGDLAKWIGKNPKGKWRLQAIDTGYLNNKTDGQIVQWSVSMLTLSNKKVQIKGDLIVNGKITELSKPPPEGVPVGKTSAPCTSARVGTLRWDTAVGLQVCDVLKDKAKKVYYAWVAALPKRAIWSGGCKSHSKGNGWATYCLNGTDFNSAADYLSAATGGTVTAKISGYYRINMWADQHGCGAKRMRLFVNGVQRFYTHIDENDGSYWHQALMSVVWPLRKGDTFYLSLHANGCNPYRWHYWNANGSHSRLQIEYVGRYAD